MGSSGPVGSWPRSSALRTACREGDVLRPADGHTPASDAPAPISRRCLDAAISTNTKAAGGPYRVALGAVRGEVDSCGNSYGRPPLCGLDGRVPGQ